MVMIWNDKDLMLSDEETERERERGMMESEERGGEGVLEIGGELSAREGGEALSNK